MSKKSVAGLFQRTTAGQIVIKRFAVLCVLFLVVCGKHSDLFCNQVASSLQLFQQQRCAKLRNRADISAVKTAIRFN